MFAVIKTGGKQYRIAEGDVIDVEKISGKAGEKITIAEVLMVGQAGRTALLGSPLVKGASVTAEILGQVKGDKVIIFKKKRRHNYRRKNGHRQQFTSLRILGIKADNKE